MPLEQVEAKIAAEGKPCSCDLPRYRAQGRVNVVHTVVELKNVASVWEGSGPAAEETIVVGATTTTSAGPVFGAIDGPKAGVRPGVDNDPSGTAVLMEVARQIAAPEREAPPPRGGCSVHGRRDGLMGQQLRRRIPAFRWIAPRRCSTSTWSASCTTAS